MECTRDISPLSNGTPSAAFGLLTFPKEIQLSILEHFCSGVLISVPFYLTLCGQNNKVKLLEPPCEPKGDAKAKLCRLHFTPFSHAMLQVNRELREDYIKVLRHECNLLICHCTIFKHYEILANCFTPKFTATHVDRLHSLSTVLKHTPVLFTPFYGYDGPQTRPSHSAEHDQALTTLGVHISLLLGINGTNPFKNLEQLTVYWYTHTKETLLALSTAELDDVMDLIHWKTRSRLLKLHVFRLQVEYGNQWKRCEWLKTRTHWSQSGELQNFSNNPIETLPSSP